MAKETLKLSLAQDGEGSAEMTAEEAKELSDILANQAKAADELTNQKKEGRVDMEIGDGRIVVSVSKATIAKEDVKD